MLYTASLSTYSPQARKTMMKKSIMGESEKDPNKGPCNPGGSEPQRGRAIKSIMSKEERDLSDIFVSGAQNLQL